MIFHECTPSKHQESSTTQEVRGHPHTLARPTSSICCSSSVILGNSWSWNLGSSTAFFTS